MNKKAYITRFLLSICIFSAMIVFIFGKIPYFGLMNIQISALFQRILVDFSISALILAFVIFIITILCGRFYCSVICPFGVFQEISSFLRGKRKNSYTKNFKFKYLVSAFVFGCLIGGSSLFLRHIDPYSIFGSMSSFSIFGLIFAGAIFVLVFFKNRFFVLIFAQSERFWGLYQNSL